MPRQDAQHFPESWDEVFEFGRDHCGTALGDRFVDGLVHELGVPVLGGSAGVVEQLLCVFVALVSELRDPVEVAGPDPLDAVGVAVVAGGAVVVDDAVHVAVVHEGISGWLGCPDRV
ncbi:hypothetical protein [Nocardioides sp. HB32]